MGMFDYIKYEGREYQTKDTPAQALEYYEIRNDELWYEDHDLEFIDEPGMLFGGYYKKVNVQWKFLSDFDGAVRFYRMDDDNDNIWIEYKALFMDGKIVKIVDL
jgi:hypothetical protein